MTFCGPARDTVLTNRQTEKLNFDTNYITMKFVRLPQISILAKVNISEFDHGSNIVNCKYHNHSEFRVFERSFHILSFVYIQRLTVTVEYEDNPPVQVDVLDTDTIEQAKEKIMEVLFKVSHFMIRAYLRFVCY